MALNSAMGWEVGGGWFGVHGCGEDPVVLRGYDSMFLFHFRRNPFPHPVYTFADRFCDCCRPDVHYRDDSYLQILTGNHLSALRLEHSNDGNLDH